MRAELVSVLAVAGTTVSVGLVLPQVWRTLVRRQTEGLAAAHVWSALLQAATWVHYGLLVDALGAALCSALTALLQAAVLLGVARCDPRAVGRQAAVVLPVAGAWAALHAGLADAGAVAAVGVLTALLSIAASVPQPWVMLRRPDLDLRGLSVTSWWLSAVANACWVGYWLLLGEPGLVPAPLVGLAAAALVLALLRGAACGRPHPAVRLARRRAARRAAAAAPARSARPAGAPRRAGRAGPATAGGRGPGRSAVRSRESRARRAARPARAAVRRLVRA